MNLLRTTTANAIIIGKRENDYKPSAASARTAEWRRWRDIASYRSAAPELARLVRVRENLIEQMADFISDYIDGFDHEGKALIRANNLLKEVEE